MRRAALVLAALTLSAVSGCAGRRDDRVAIVAPGAPAAIGPYSQAIVSEDILWASGQLGLDPATGSLVEGGIEAQTRRALDNLKAVLAAAGFGMDEVVQTQVFLADLEDFKAMNAVYAEYFPLDPPARATVEVSRLPRDARIEIALVARKRR